MSILTTAERVGIKKGREEGLKEAISDILEIKFGVVGRELLDHIEQVADIETLQKIRAGLKQAKSVAEAKALIHAHANF
ncbi:hypothetical protein L0337_32150 [candidate division KSB1 bacterium]|nr:hypothetical protein [candidate division KSB1 bacterium]